MKRNILYAAITILLTSCNIARKVVQSSPFEHARWIAYEQLDDSMKIVPGVSGSDDHLGNKGIKRSVIPLFRKEFHETGDIKQPPPLGVVV